MKAFLEQAQFYAQYHQKAATFYTHLIGVPLIIFSLMIFFGFLHLIIPGVLDATLACILTFILWVYYVRLNWRLGLLLLPVLMLMLWLSSLISHVGPNQNTLLTFIILFVLGCLLQLIGHFIEGRKPAFMDNFRQALIAPMFLVAELCFMAGRMQSLKTALHGQAETSDVVK